MYQKGGTLDINTRLKVPGEVSDTTVSRWRSSVGQSGSQR
jgi:hypothetical protein